MQITLCVDTAIIRRNSVHNYLCVFSSVLDLHTKEIILSNINLTEQNGAEKEESGSVKNYNESEAI
jgi:hypothetical protein